VSDIIRSKTNQASWPALVKQQLSWDSVNCTKLRNNCHLTDELSAARVCVCVWRRAGPGEGGRIHFLKRSSSNSCVKTVAIYGP